MIGEQHMKIFKAIKGRDPNRAGKEARMHIDFVEVELREILQNILTSLWWSRGFSNTLDT